MELASPKILIIETNPDTAQSLTELLAGSYEVSVLNTAVNAYQEVRLRHPDLVIMNIDLSDFNGFDLLHNLRTSTKTRDIFVTIVTENPSVNCEVQAFQLGVVDYIRRPFDAQVFYARVSSALQRVQRFRTLEKLATIDPLTELPNRRAFNKTFVTEWGRSLRYSLALSLLVIDIDNFKSYNDSYGHPQGDIILQEVSKVFASCINRSADSLYRMGGEEFAVLLPATDAQGAVELAEHIRQATAAHEIQLNNGEIQTKVTVSIGVSSTIAAEDKNMSDLMEQADMLMYQSKNSGRNKVSVKFNS